MDELIERIRELAEGLASEHFKGPPVDPFALAEGLGVTVVRGGAVPRWVIKQGRATVHLPKDMLPERLRFTLAHEILEVVAAQSSPPLPLVRELAHRAERLFQLGAADLLMPRRWFAEAGRDSGWDLGHLRELFGVSWEAAARRVPVCTPAICTIVDNGRASPRVGSDGLAFPRGPTPEEQEAISAAYDAWPAAEPVRRSAPDFTCVAWPALPERNRIRRVCLLTYPSE
jgi:hypothetical protein